MSYSHAADAQFAPFLQRAVQGFAKPWYKLRSVRIFRDQTGLSLTPELWPDIERAVRASRLFVLLASPEAAASKWVCDEVRYWLTLRRAPPLIVVTGGAVQWDAVRGDFDWSRTTALPQALAGAYEYEPLYLDAAAIKTEELASRNSKIATAAAQIYSRLTNRSLDEVIGADVRQHRRNQWTAGTALAVLAAAGVMYVLQRAETRRQETIAATRRQLDIAKSLAIESLSRNGGPGAVNISENDAGRAAILAVESVNLTPTLEGNDALQAHLVLSPAITGTRKLPSGATLVALGRNGESIAVSSENGEISVLPASGEKSGTPVQAGPESSRMFLTDDGRVFAFRPGQLSEPGANRSWEVSAQAPSGFYLSPDGRFYATLSAASAESETTVTLARTGGPVVGVWKAGHPLSPTIAFSRNSAFLAFVEGTRVAVADVSTGTLRRSADTELVEITAVAVDDTGDAVLVLGWETDPRYIIKKNFIVRSFPTTGISTFRPIFYRGESDLGISGLAIDIRRGLVALGGGAPGWVKVMDYFTTSTLAVIRNDDMIDWTLSAAPENPVIVTASRTRVRAWAIGRETAEAASAPLTVEADIGPAGSLSGTGARVAVAGMNRESRLPSLAIFDVASGRKDVDLPGMTYVNRLLMSPDGDYLAVWSGDGAQIVSLTSRQPLFSFPARPNSGRNWPLIAFSADGKYAIWGADETGISIGDLGMGKQRTISGPLRNLIAVAVSPDGAAAWGFESGKRTEDGSRQYLRVETRDSDGKTGTFETVAFPGRGARANMALAFDGSGKMLAVGISHGSLRVLDTRSRRSIVSLFYEGEMRRISFNSDGRYLLTTGTGRLLANEEQNEVAIWSLAESRRVWRRLTNDSIYGWSMTPNDGPVVIAHGTTVRRTGYLGIETEKLYWKANDLVRIGCKRISYRLGPEERQAFLPDLPALTETSCPAPPR